MGKGKDMLTKGVQIQGLAATALVALAVISVIGMVVMGLLNTSITGATAGMNATILAIVAGIAIFGTFSTISALIIVAKMLVGAFKNFGAGSGDIISSIKEQGTSVLAMVGLGVVAVIGFVLLDQLQLVAVGIAGIPAGVNATIITSVTAFEAGLAIFGTFATVTALVIVAKALVSIVKGFSN